MAPIGLRQVALMALLFSHQGHQSPGDGTATLSLHRGTSRITEMADRQNHSIIGPPKSWLWFSAKI
jgi:hypothetical protein